MTKSIKAKQPIEAAPQEQQPDTPKAEKKIAIFGTTPSRMLGPWKDGSGWTRWTIGPGGKDSHNWERLYEAHHVWPADFAGYLCDLSNEKREVRFMDDPHKLIDRWRRTKNIPDDVMAKFGKFSTATVIPHADLEEKYGRTWFSSSIAWLQAEAIEAGATDVGMWGIDLESSEEYIAQFVGCRHFIDVCRLVGINVHLPAGCALTREPRSYPQRFETNMALNLESKAKYLDALIGQTGAEFDGLRCEVYRTEGRVLLLRELLAEFPIPPERIQQTERGLIETNAKFAGVQHRLLQLQGERGGIEHVRRIWVYNGLDPELTL